jgi:VanZ family protein
MSPKITYGFRLLLLLVLVAMTYLLLNKPSGNVQGLLNDKLAHAMGFFVLAGVADLAFPNTRFLWKALLLGGYGLLTEYLQLLSGYRHFSWWDWLADIAGIVCFLPFQRPVHRLLSLWFPAPSRL